MKVSQRATGSNSECNSTGYRLHGRINVTATFKLEERTAHLFSQNTPSVSIETEVVGVGRSREHGGAPISDRGLGGYLNLELGREPG